MWQIWEVSQVFFLESFSPWYEDNICPNKEIDTAWKFKCYDTCQTILTVKLKCGMYEKLFKYFFLRVFLLYTKITFVSFPLATTITFVQIKEACGSGTQDGEAPDVPPHQLCPTILPIWKNTSRYDILTWQAFSMYFLLFQLCFFISGHFWLLTWGLRPIESSCVTPDLGNFYSNYFPLFPRKFILITWFDEFLSLQFFLPWREVALMVAPLLLLLMKVKVVVKVWEPQRKQYL